MLIAVAFSNSFFQGGIPKEQRGGGGGGGEGGGEERRGKL